MKVGDMYLDIPHKEEELVQQYFDEIMSLAVLLDYNVELTTLEDFENENIEEVHLIFHKGLNVYKILFELKQGRVWNIGLIRLGAPSLQRIREMHQPLKRLKQLIMEDD